MPNQVIMPQLGESVDEGTITRWLKGPGDQVEEYEPLVEVNTDKVDSEIPSPYSGTLLEILVEEGTTVKAGEVLALIGEPGEQPDGEPEDLAGTRPVQVDPAASDLEETRVTQVRPRDLEDTQPEPAEEEQPEPEGERSLGFISPIVSKIAGENNIDLSRVKGTGMGGRITKNDVLAYLARRTAGGDGAEEPTRQAERPAAAAQPEAAPAAAQPAVRPAAQPGAAPSGAEVMPMTAVRRAIADHMVMSKRTSPHVTTIMEANLQRVVAHRQANKAAFARDGANLTFTAYFVAAAVAALKAYPVVNSSWSDEGILLHRQIHIGMATALEKEGLIVPVIKNADGLSLLGIARAVNDLSSRARQKKLQPDEVKGGTFTITNHGTSGSLFATPIINQPQCGILGVGAVQKRVVVVEQDGYDAMVIRPMVYLSLTFDHRILDGAVADYFLGTVVKSLENWG
jgi:2-oxoglutarate dehydrogenase dihydrolipoamide succinyltransferase (E2 component)